MKKSTFSDDEIPIYEEAIVLKRGDYWQMKMWLPKEKKYARFSLKTRNKDTAIDKAKKHYHDIKAQELAGKTYFSKTTKQGVEDYLNQRAKDVEVGVIVKGRLSTIKTHLEHWLDYIGRDTKLKELERTVCENYLHSRTKTKKKLTISQTTVANEQSTINACLKYLFRQHLTHIDKFDFKKLPCIDRNNEAIRRSNFEPIEFDSLVRVLSN